MHCAVPRNRKKGSDVVRNRKKSADVPRSKMNRRSLHRRICTYRSVCQRKMTVIGTVRKTLQVQAKKRVMMRIGGHPSVSRSMAMKSSMTAVPTVTMMTVTRIALHTTSFTNGVKMMEAAMCLVLLRRRKTQVPGSVLGAEGLKISVKSIHRVTDHGL